MMNLLHKPEFNSYDVLPCCMDDKVYATFRMFQDESVIFVIDLKFTRYDNSTAFLSFNPPDAGKIRGIQLLKPSASDVIAGKLSENPRFNDLKGQIAGAGRP